MITLVKCIYDAVETATNCCYLGLPDKRFSRGDRFYDRVGLEGEFVARTYLDSALQTKTQRRWLVEKIATAATTVQWQCCHADRCLRAV